jgi:hypothetical protein
VLPSMRVVASFMRFPSWLYLLGGRVGWLVGFETLAARRVQGASATP